MNKSFFQKHPIIAPAIPLLSLIVLIWGGIFIHKAAWDKNEIKAKSMLEHIGIESNDKSSLAVENTIFNTIDTQNINKLIVDIHVESNLPDNFFEVQQLQDGTLAIIGIKGGSGNLIIPSRLFGFNVSKVEGVNTQSEIRYGYVGFRNIDNLIIPIGIIEIGEEAFQYNLSYMRHIGFVNISLPNGLKKIGRYAFRQAIPGILSLEPDPLEKVHVKSIILPSSLEYVGQRAFEAIDIDYLKIESIFTVEQPTDYNRSPIFNKGKIICIELVGNLSDQWLNFVFEDKNFINFYISQGRRAGIYLFDGRLWRIGTNQDVNIILANNNSSLNSTTQLDTNEGTTRSQSFQREHEESRREEGKYPVIPSNLVLPSGENVKERVESGDVTGK